MSMLAAVNWRAAGCLVAGAVAFVALGLFAMSLAFRDVAGCPATLQWEDRRYDAVGVPTASPHLGAGEAVRLGSTFMGPVTRAVYGPPGSSPSTRAEDRPDTIALDCGDGTFLAYRWDGVTITPAPTEGAALL